MRGPDHKGRIKGRTRAGTSAPGRDADLGRATGARPPRSRPASSRGPRAAPRPRSPLLSRTTTRERSARVPGRLAGVPGGRPSRGERQEVRGDRRAPSPPRPASGGQAAATASGSPRPPRSPASRPIPPRPSRPSRRPSPRKAGEAARRNAAAAGRIGPRSFAGRRAPQGENEARGRRPPHEMEGRHEPAPVRPPTRPPGDAGRPAGTGPRCGTRAGPRDAPTVLPGPTRPRGRTAPPPPPRDRGGSPRFPDRTPRVVPERGRATARGREAPAPRGPRFGAARPPAHRSRARGPFSMPRDLPGEAARTASPARWRRALRPRRVRAGGPSPPSRPEAPAGGDPAPRGSAPLPLASSIRSRHWINRSPNRSASAVRERLARSPMRRNPTRRSLAALSSSRRRASTGSARTVSQVPMVRSAPAKRASPRAASAPPATAARADHPRSTKTRRQSSSMARSPPKRWAVPATSIRRSSAPGATQGPYRSTSRAAIRMTSASRSRSRGAASSAGHRARASPHPMPALTPAASAASETAATTVPLCTTAATGRPSSRSDRARHSVANRGSHTQSTRRIVPLHQPFMRSRPAHPPERPTPPERSRARRHGGRFPAALRPTHFARPGKEHEAESLAGLGRELKPAAVHGAHPPGRLDHHRGETRFTKPGFRRPERRRLVSRPSHHETVRIEAESGEPRRMKGGEWTAFDHAPQDRPAEAHAQHRHEGGGPRAGHRMHPTSSQPATEPTVDLPSVHARPGQSPPPFERSDPGSQLFPRTLHAETVMGSPFSPESSRRRRPYGRAGFSAKPSGSASLKEQGLPVRGGPRPDHGPAGKRPALPAVHHMPRRPGAPPRRFFSGSLYDASSVRMSIERSSSPQLSPGFVARAPRCRGGGSHGPQDAEGVADLPRSRCRSGLREYGPPP